jgi:hypothetical protein
MIHKLTIGHLDPAAVQEGRVVLTRPLDMTIVTRLLGQFGELDGTGRPTSGGWRIEFHDGYIVCPWLMPSPVPGVAEFVLQLQNETGCVLADVNRCTVIDRELLLAQSYPRSRPRAESGQPIAGGSRRR